MLDLDSAVLLLSQLKIPRWPDSQLTNFILKYNQWVFHEKLKEQIADGHPIRAVIDKSRRVGVSSYICGLGVAHCIAQENARTVIVAHRADSVSGLFDVPLALVRDLHLSGYDIPPPLQKKITFPHPGGDSTMVIATAGDAVGGRGKTVTFLHLSEAARYQGGGTTIETSFTSLLPAVANHPSTAIFVESTAYGKVGLGEPFYQFYMDARAGKNEYIAVFLSWLDDILCKRPADEAADGPKDDDERDITQLVGCKRYCGRCSACHKALQCIAWRRWAIPNLVMGDVDKFHQEYPTTDDESFVTSQERMFTRDELRLARANVRPPIAKGRLEFDVTPAREKERPVVLIPDSESPLWIHASPIASHHYYMGADVARGQEGGDFSTAGVWCGETGELAACYNARVNPEQLAKLLNLLGRYYNNAMATIELTGNLGLWSQKVLRDAYNYPNFYFWKGRDDRLEMGFKQRVSIGWETNRRTKPMMVASFRAAIRTGLAKIYDERLVKQMEGIEAERESGPLDPIAGHDDIAMGCMIGWIAGEQWHRQFGGMASRLTLDDPKQTDDEISQIHKADQDIQGMARKHWDKLQALIKGKGRKMYSRETRLEGI